MSKKDNNITKKGRKGKFNATLCTKAEELLSKKDLLDYKLAEILGIGMTMFYAWKNPKDPLYKSEFSEAIDRGRQRYREMLADTIDDDLIKLAFGFEYEEERIEYDDKDKSSGGKIVVTKKRKEGSPSLAWNLAKSLKPHMYKDRVETVNTSENKNINININDELDDVPNILDMSPLELRRFIAARSKEDTKKNKNK